MSAKDNIRKVTIDLKSVREKIPRNAVGDPAFETLGLGEKIPPEWEPEEGSLLAIFTPEQIVAMVNRYLYQHEYQTELHRKRSQEYNETMKPVKEALKRLFPGVSFINATEQQLKAATELVKKERGK